MPSHRALGSDSPTRILLTLVLLAVVGLMDALGFFEGPDRHFYDLFFRIRGPRTPSRDIVIAAVDEPTLKRLGRWPIPRRHYAALLDRLESASVVALDILMDEPSEAEDDRLLAEAISRHVRVVLPALVPSRRHAGPAKPLFSGAARGHIHVEQGIDGVTREIFHTIFVNGQPIPSFARATLQTLQPDLPTSTPSSTLPEDGSAEFILQAEPMTINFYGPTGTFQYLSALSILQGLCPQSLIDGKIVLVGLTAPPDDGEAVTPFFEDRNRMPAVEVHSTILNNLMDDSFIRRDDPWKTGGMLLLLTSGGLFLFPRFSPNRLLLVWLCVVAVLCFAFFRLFVSRFLWIPPTPFFAAAAGSLLIVYMMTLRRTQQSLMALQRDWEESFHAIDDAIVVHDARCELLRVNRAASELPGDLVLRHFEGRCRQLKELSTQLSARGAHPGEPGAERIPTEELHDAEADRHYEIRSVPRRDERNQFVGGVHVVRDISRRKQHEREQRELQLMLSQAQKMEAIGTLSGGIAHDFNNILSGIMGYTEIVYRQLPEQSPLRGKLEQVLKASSRARDIIQQLLTFSRKASHDRTALAMGPLVTEAIKLVRVMLPATIEIRQDVRSSGTILGDPTQVHQILLNLATNAFHAMRDQGGILTFTLEDVALEEPLHLDGQMVKAGPYIKLGVADTGHGIPADVRDHIFEPYFTTKKHGEGTGLGLATVRGIVRDYGGLITVDSEAGQGARFSIFLPRLESAAPQEPPIAPESRVLGHGHVLLVDDEVDLTDLLQDMLELLGYGVTCSNSPKEALELFQTAPHRFNLVITDMSMPGMTGEDLARELIRIRPDVPVILCTGYGDAVFRERAAASGIRRLLTKPFKLQELSKVLDEIVRSDGRTSG